MSDSGSGIRLLSVLVTGRVESRPMPKGGVVLGFDVSSDSMRGLVPCSVFDRTGLVTVSSGDRISADVVRFDPGNGRFPKFILEGVTVE